MATAPNLFLGSSRNRNSTADWHAQYLLPAHHLVTQGVIVGMTGSGKTGILFVTVEEALHARIPVLMIDVKGDLPNLLLAFPSFAPGAILPWVEATMSPDETGSPMDVARAAAQANGCARFACSTRFAASYRRTGEPADEAPDRRAHETGARSGSASSSRCRIRWISITGHWDPSHDRR